jgi:hypothetical protein
MAMITQLNLEQAIVVLRIKDTDANNSALYDLVEACNSNALCLEINLQTPNYVELLADYSMMELNKISDAEYEVAQLTAYLKANLPCKRKVNELDYIAEKFALECENAIDEMQMEAYFAPDRLTREMKRVDVEYLRNETDKIAQELLAY